MGIFDEALKAIRDATAGGGQYKDPTQLARDCGFEPNLISRWLSGERSPKLNKIGPVLDKIGFRLVAPDERPDTTRDVALVVDVKMMQVEPGVRPPASAHYFAVPLADGAVAAGRGLLADEGVKGWILVYRNQESIRFRSNLVAFTIGKNQESMIPTLHPGDIVLVDRGDFDKGFKPPGNIFLVREPDDSIMVKRVVVKPKDGDMTITFYSDNAAEHPPLNYSLNQDYGKEIGRAIVGRVVWAWSDMARK